MKNETINHYTLLTGHNRVSPSNEVPDKVLDILYELLTKPRETPNAPIPVPGYESYAFTPYFCESSLIIDIHRGKDLLCWFTVVKEKNQKDMAWQVFVTRSESEVPPFVLRGKKYSEPQAPYCAAMINPTKAKSATEFFWMGDFERCIAWTFLKRF